VAWAKGLMNMRLINISLWILLICNFSMAMIFLCAPFSFPRWLETLSLSFTPQEQTILDRNVLGKVDTLRVSGPIEGESEIVRRTP
jgi:hypothetical protein